MRVFQRFSSLELHLSIGKCFKSLERQSLLDLAKTQHAPLLAEGVGKIPTLISREPYETDETLSNAEEVLALKEFRESYRFNEAQKSYLQVNSTLARQMEESWIQKQ